MSRLSSCYSPRLPRGFTMIELMVTVAILAILVALGAPSFARVIAINRISSQTNEFSAGLKLARAEAIRRGQPVTMRSLSTSDVGDFARAGWEVFPDQNGDGASASPSTTADGTPIRRNPVTDGSVVIRRVDRSMSGGVTSFTPSALADDAKRVVIFSSRGTAAGNADAFFRVCDAPNTSVKGRIIRVSVIGNVSTIDAQATCTS